MKTNKNQRKRLLAHCGELHEEDGADPRRFFQHDRSRRQGNRKAMQLCSQVARTLDLLLAGEFADEALQGLQVVSVRPAPDTSQLCVTLRRPGWNRYRCRGYPGSTGQGCRTSAQ